jgi:hypothetical protein
MAKIVVEKRSFPRVSLAASGLLVYRDGVYRARVENISLSGALLSLETGEVPEVSRGEHCSLALRRDACGSGLRLSTRIVHFGYDMVCLRFVNLDQNTRLMLRSIIAHHMPETRPTPALRSLSRG